MDWEKLPVGEEEEKSTVRTKGPEPTNDWPATSTVHVVDETVLITAGEHVTEEVVVTLDTVRKNVPELGTLFESPEYCAVMVGVPEFSSP